MKKLLFGMGLLISGSIGCAGSFIGGSIEAAIPNSGGSPPTLLLFLFSLCVAIAGLVIGILGLKAKE